MNQKGRRSKEKAKSRILKSKKILLRIVKIKTFLKKRLNTPDADLFGCEENKKALYNSIVKSIQTGESNSLFVIGPRGSGKTTLLRQVLKEIHHDSLISDNFMKVELNGLIHTDDKLSLQAISYQLCKQSLDLEATKTGSFSENLALILKSLKSGTKENKCILFILENCELFSQKSQMIYNLYDFTSQSPMFILGLTTENDAIDLLEKRVKCRISPHKLYTTNEIKFESYISYATDLLKLPATFESDYQDWNNEIEKLIQDKTVYDVFNKLFHINKRFDYLKRLLESTLFSLLDHYHPLLVPEDFVRAYSELFLHPKMTILIGLSLLEISLIIAMMKMTVKSQMFNFEMLYEEYQKYISKNPTVQQFDKDAVYKAYEHLKAMELIEVSEHSSRHVCLQLDSEAIMNALKVYPNLPKVLHQWALATVDE